MWAKLSTGVQFPAASYGGKPPSSDSGDTGCIDAGTGRCSGRNDSGSTGWLGEICVAAVESKAHNEVMEIVRIGDGMEGETRPSAAKATARKLSDAVQYHAETCTTYIWYGIRYTEYTRGDSTWYGTGTGI